ncbi:MAG: ABC transporter ATP-binding protein, partial [Saprospirales bacterium]
LSGGEKRRLYLLSILIQNPNFLILDEPTNDLDIVTLNVLEDYLLDFPGCLLIVSHDRFFMDKIIDHLFVFEGNERLIDFPGSYTDYRNWQDEKLQSDRNKLQSEQKASKATSAPQQLSQSEDREKKKEIKRLEKKIQNLETEKTGILGKFEQQSIPVDEIGEWSAKLDNIKNQIEALEEEWMELVG